jgi:hypothetical protein
MINIFVESAARDSKYSELTSILNRLDDVALADDPAVADAILLTDDDATLIRKSLVYQAFKSKCVVISDGDILSYYIPALYASNFRCLLSQGRALTVSPYASLLEDERRKRNVWINKLKDADFEKRLLYSFMGGSTCWLRKRLLKQYADCALEDVLIKCTDRYKNWSVGDEAARSEQQRLYVETMLSSKFAVCPRGASAASIRLFEAMELGCAPVVLADSWIPVDGVDWSFCLFVKEDQLPDLDKIIRSHAGEWKQRGAVARRTFEENFSHSTLGSTLERQIRQLLATRNANSERLIHAIYPVRRALVEGRAAARASLRNAILFGFRLAGRKFPYDLNR